MKKISRRKFIITTTAALFGTGYALFNRPDTSLFLHEMLGNTPLRPQGLSLHPRTSEITVEEDPNFIEVYKPAIEKFPETKIKKIFYFYPWYLREWDGMTNSYIFHHWRDGYELTPLIGIYDSRNPDVIEWQMRNMRIVEGIPAISYFRRGKLEEKTVKEHILKSPSIKNYNVSFCLHVETHDLFGIDKTKLNVAENILGLQLTSKQKTAVKNEFDYISGEGEYFDHPNYYKIDGKHVVFLYEGDGFFDISRTEFKTLVKDIKETVEENGKEIFLIGEIDFWKNPGYWQKYLIEQYDGITTYIGYEENALKKFGNDFENVYYKRCEMYKKEAEKKGILFIPNITAGFKVKGKPELPRDILSFRKRANNAIKLIDDINSLVTITSYNEYKENSATEPTKQEGYKHWNEIGKLGTELWDD